ncbi:MAG: molybdopterin-dependent oxidoreductase [Acidimicrobiales bacterium]|nr:molybdopterin-dependent oxidoreductase [Acidimicrobiales bacterium]
MTAPERKQISEAEFRIRSRRSFLTGGAAVAAGLYGWRRILDDEPVDRIPGILRSMHERNGDIWQALYSPDRMAPTFDPSDARRLRVNGRHGVREEIDLTTWSAQVIGSQGEQIGEHPIADFHTLPFTEMTVEHKCVEGWSEVVTWGGTPFANFAASYSAEADADYVGLQTPDGDYYVGLERDAMLHPQTLLAWELNGEPLTQLHGAPLRLVTPLKYGIKQLKRIGRIEFTDTRPPDYWGERGYDYYSGL